MDRLGNQIFARAAGTAQQDGGVVDAGQHLHDVMEFFYRFTGSDKIIQTDVAGRTLPMMFDFPDQLVLVQGPFNNDADFVQFKGFVEIVESPPL